MKHTLLATALLPAFAAAAPDTDGETVLKLIERHYNRPFPAQKCQLTAPPKDSYQQPENFAYCMKPAAAHTVNRNGKTTRYVLYTGFAYDTREKRKDESHAASGLAELFVLEKTGGTWVLKQHGRSEIGAWGEPPQEWRFVQVGGQNWGYQTESGYTNQGVTETAQSFIFTDNNGVAHSDIPASNDNGGMYGDCNEYKGAEKRSCQNSQTSLEAEITFNRAAEHNGVWEIQAVLSGRAGKTRYAKQKYAMPYNSGKRSHLIPKNYPI